MFPLTGTTPSRWATRCAARRRPGSSAGTRWWSRGRTTTSRSSWATASGTAASSRTTRGRTGTRRTTSSAGPLRRGGPGPGRGVRDRGGPQGHVRRVRREVRPGQRRLPHGGPRCLRQPYDRAAYIDLGVADAVTVETRARDDADRRGWTFARRRRPVVVRRLLAGDWEDDFLVVRPGERVVMSYDEEVIRAEPVA